MEPVDSANSGVTPKNESYKSEIHRFPRLTRVELAVELSKIHQDLKKTQANCKQIQNFVNQLNCKDLPSKDKKSCKEFQKFLGNICT